MCPKIILHLLPRQRRKNSASLFSASSPTHFTHLSISTCKSGPNFSGYSIAAFIVTTATGFKSLANTFNPYRAASNGILPSPANASNTAGVRVPHIASHKSCTRFNRSCEGGVLYNLRSQRFSLPASLSPACARSNPKRYSNSSTVTSAGNSDPNTLARLNDSGLREYHRCNPLNGFPPCS